VDLINETRIILIHLTILINNKKRNINWYWFTRIIFTSPVSPVNHMFQTLLILYVKRIVVKAAIMLWLPKKMIGLEEYDCKFKYVIDDESKAGFWHWILYDVDMIKQANYVLVLKVRKCIMLLCNWTSIHNPITAEDYYW
jgi:hypothetical protein